MSSGRVLYIGNVAYDATESDVRAVLDEVPGLYKFTLKQDTMHSSAHQGYGFAEYDNASAAANAVRLLNGRAVGSRSIKLDFANDKSSRSSGPVDPVSHERFSDVQTDPQIAAALAHFSPLEMWTMVTKFREFVDREEANARLLLSQRPDLGQALLQMQKYLFSLPPPQSSAAPVPAPLPPKPLLPPPAYAPAVPVPQVPVPHVPVPVPQVPVPQLPPPVKPEASAPIAPPPVNTVSTSDPRLKDPRVARRVESAAPAAPPPPPPASVDPEQLRIIQHAARMSDSDLRDLNARAPSQASEIKLLRSVLAMSQEDVAKLPPADKEELGTLWQSLQPYKPYL